jgi:hypothetical protein
VGQIAFSPTVVRAAMRMPLGFFRQSAVIANILRHLWLLLLISGCLYTLSLAEAISPSRLAALRYGFGAVWNEARADQFHRKETEDLFYHGYENYMTHAFPEDELRPLSCKPLTRDAANPGHFEINDALGNYSLTLIDSLSTLAVLASSPSSKKRNKPLLLFQDGVQRLVEQYGDGSIGSRGSGLRSRGFDLDSKVQVFETAIRGLGGLLSAHLFAIGDLPIRGYAPHPSHAAHAADWEKNTTSTVRGIKWSNGMLYDGQLLRLAHDLGSRLIPAFWTETGIPYPRVNLRTGIPFYAKSPLNFDPVNGQCDVHQQPNAEVTETCSAGAGSLVLEFTVLSRLTGDHKFEELAKRAFWAIWDRRTSIGLVGAGIDAETGNWISPWTGIGAGIDSFYEYAFKSFVLLSRDNHPNYKGGDAGKDPRMLFEPLDPRQESALAFYEAWTEAQAAIKRHVHRGTNFQHPHYIQVDLYTGASRGFWVDALSAFYPGVLALAGHVEEAIETHLLQTALWTRFSGLPERWNLVNGNIEGGLGWWVGRPEFIESNYYIYRATEDPWYIYVAEMTLRDIKRRCWTRCGWASIQSVLTGEQQDRMESFFLGETAKYLFLTFDPEHPLNKLDGPVVFSTEGHPLTIPARIGHEKSHATAHVPPSVLPGVCEVKPSPVPFTVSATAARGDIYHAASLARLHLMPMRDNLESVLGEYATDHPSITLADLGSPSNYTYFPWTLPPSLVPHNSMTSLLPTKPTFDISFPQLSNPGTQAPPLQRLGDGILINNIGGLKLGMVQDVPLYDGRDDEAYRIHAINNLALGKDEKVFLARDNGHGALNPADPYFTKIRDTVMLDLLVDAAIPSRHNSTVMPSVPTAISEFMNDDLNTGVKNALSAIISQLSTLMKSTPFSIPMPSHKPSVAAETPGKDLTTIPAITATGLGAAAIPDWPETPSSLLKTLGSQAVAAPLMWDKIYASGDLLCKQKLQASVPRTHQVIVVRRGGCSFSQKLANIPAFPPGPGSLQLVIVVNYGDNNGDVPESSQGSDTDSENQLIRPLLDERQVSASGLARQEDIPMVLVGGGENVWTKLRSARGIGVRRRWEIRVGGVKVDNLVIL